MTEKEKQDLVIELFNINQIQAFEVVGLHAYHVNTDIVLFMFDDGQLPPILLDYVYGAELYDDEYDAVHHNYDKIYDALVEHKIVDEDEEDDI